MDATLFVEQCITSNRVNRLFWNSTSTTLWIKLPGILITKDKETGLITVRNSHSNEEFTATITDRLSGATAEFIDIPEDLIVKLKPDVPYVLEITTTSNIVFGKEQNSLINYREEKKEVTKYTVNFNPE
jgi:hypothetical protein